MPVNASQQNLPDCKHLQSTRLYQYEIPLRTHPARVSPPGRLTDDSMVLNLRLLRQLLPRLLLWAARDLVSCIRLADVALGPPVDRVIAGTLLLDAQMIAHFERCVVPS